MTNAARRAGSCRRSGRLWVLLGAMGLVLTACGGGDDDEPAQLPNPAAVFCEEQGGTVSGPEPMCRLPDGSEVDAWAYFREKAPRVSTSV